MCFVTSMIGATARAVGVAVFLAGCSGGGQAGLPATNAPGSQTAMQRSAGLPPAVASVSQFNSAGLVRSSGEATRGSASPGKDADGVYATTGTASGQSVVNEYPSRDRKNGNPLCSINGGTSIFGGDIATDRQGNLWIPTIAQPSINSIWEVVEYAPGCGQQLLSLADSATGQPSDIAFDRTGTAYVANSVSASFGPGNVAVYLTGQTSRSKVLSPSRVLTSPLIGAFVIAVAVNADDDVYITYDTASYKSQVLEFAKGKGSGTAVNISGFSVIDGITFDDHQNMILTDYNLAQDEVYAPPYAGSPTTTIPLVAGSKPLFSKLNRSNSLLYVTGATGVQVYSYPAGTYQYTIMAQMGKYGAGGVALDPTARN
jgi:hypothetical protein